jgi:N-acetylglucosaminyldiphosphoundecaprenol N-acetyl-beta-D-mannosaminyltransferase
MDDFDRNVFCLLGLPFDAVSMDEALAKVRGDIALRVPCFLSTPNLNFLVGARSDADFRNSVIHSELSVADGMPLVWLARLLSIPIRERVSGSGLFDALWHGPTDKPICVYFFGGPDGVAEQASAIINSGKKPSMRCVGFECPGFGGVEDMSSEQTITRINQSNADFLVVALGARKGQEWIEHNRSRLTVPLISHLGAVVNFVAGSVSRAPVWMQRSGLEWLWRIKEEPGLWRRYWNDGVALLGLLVTHVLPYALWLQLRAHTLKNRAFSIESGPSADPDNVHILVSGFVPNIISTEVRALFRNAAMVRGSVLLDLSRARYVSPAFLGLLLMLKKHVDNRGSELKLLGITTELRRIFEWTGLGYLLPPIAPD